MVISRAGEKFWRCILCIAHRFSIYVDHLPTVAKYFISVSQPPQFLLHHIFLCFPGWIYILVWEFPPDAILTAKWMRFPLWSILQIFLGKVDNLNPQSLFPFKISPKGSSIYNVATKRSNVPRSRAQTPSVYSVLPSVDAHFILIRHLYFIFHKRE